MNPQEVEAHIRLEENYWYFVNKKYLIKSIIKRLFRFKKLKGRISILEVGPGAGTLLEELKVYGSVAGLETNDEFLKRLKIKGIDSIKGKFPDITINKKFDLIILSDVLEHIKDDCESMRKIYSLLNAKGIAIITVPAYQSLYSYHDKFLGHYRRYDKKKLSRTLLNSNVPFKMLNFSYFNSYALPPAYLLRKMIAQNSSKADTGKFNLGLVSRITLFFTFIETRMILNHLNIPFGTSLLAVLEKKG